MRRAMMIVMLAVAVCGLLMFTGVCRAASVEGGPGNSVEQSDTGAMPVAGGILLLVAAGCALGMADVANRGIPGPQDAGLVLQAAVTKAIDFDGAGLDLGAGFDGGGVGKIMAAVITVTAADRADSDETYAFHLEESADNVTFTDCGVPASVTVAAAVATLGVYVAKGIITKRYVRLVLDVDGTTPSITYSAYLNPNV